MEEIKNLLFSQIKRIPKIYFIPFSMGLVGLIIFVYGLISYFHSENRNTITENQNSVIKNKENLSQNSVKIVKKIKIDIEGAVINPGVYDLSEDSRVQESLIAAGGLSQNADRDYIQKHINLAAKISDGAKVYIPKINDREPQTDFSQSNLNGSVVLGDNSQQVNINSASVDELDALPGIGKTTAQKIINSRPYNSIQDLLTKKAVNTKVFNQIKDKITAF